MKRVPFYVALLALVWLAPVERVDVGRLQPVEVVYVYKEDGRLFLATDTGDIGGGKDIPEALNDLKETTPGVVYLDTAEYLLISEDVQTEADPIRNHLKTSVRVCLTEGNIDLEIAAKYLDVHGDLPKLKDWKTGENTPVLTEEKIIEKSRK